METVAPFPDIRLIVAVGRHGQMGLNNQLPWHDLRDLNFFADVTEGGVLVVGYKTFSQVEHLDGTRGRRVIIHGENRWIDGHQQKWDFEMPTKIARWGETIWIVGGLNTYQAWIDHMRERKIYMPWYICEVDYDGPADKFMIPPFASYPSHSETVARLREAAK